MVETGALIFAVGVGRFGNPLEVARARVGASASTCGLAGGASFNTGCDVAAASSRLGLLSASDFAEAGLLPVALPFSVLKFFTVTSGWLALDTSFLLEVSVRAAGCGSGKRVGSAETGAGGGACTAGAWVCAACTAAS